MDFQEYETAADRTFRPEDAEARILTPQQNTLLLGAIGMAAEAGEFLDHVKKHLYHDQELTPERIAKMHAELGDVLWYHRAACKGMDTTMSDVAQGNIDKLQKRHPNGVDFSYHDRQMKATEQAAIIALEGRVYKDVANAQYVFISADNKYRINVSEQELGNDPLYRATTDNEAVVRHAVMNRLTDVLQEG